MARSNLKPGTGPGRDELVEDLMAIAAMQRHYAWKRDLVAPHLGKRILEVGCGTGLMLDQLRNRELLIGIDRNVGCLKLARARVSGRPRVTLRHLDVLDPAVRRLRHYGLTGVLFANSLELIEDDLMALRHAASVLAPGGKVVILTWALGTPPPVLRTTYGLRGYRPHSLRRLLVRTGFNCIAVHWVNLLGVLGWWLDRRVLGQHPLMGSEAFARRDRIIPLARLLDRITGPPRGRLLLAIGTRR